MRQSREKRLLYIGICAALLPTLLLRDFTPPNELRYLSIADEALRSHSFFAFTNHGEVYADKPPLYFWIIMLCKWVMGSHKMWLLSLFSLLPALVTVRTMDKWAAAEAGGESRSLARLMLLTCGLFAGAAFIMRMDMLMCMFIVLSLRSFWRMSAEPDKAAGERWLFPLWLFLAVFTKGPVGLLVPLGGTVVYLAVTGRTGEFPRYWGWRTWGVLAACCAVWFGAAYAEGGGAYLYDLLFQQTVGRAVNSFHHAEPFYYYAVSIWYSLAPWSLLVAGVVAAALRPAVVRSDLQRFFLCVGIATIVLLSCISSKLEIYLLPAIPFLVYAAAMFLPRFRGSVWMRIALAVPSVAFSLALPLLVVLSRCDGMPYLNEGMLYAAATILTLTGAHSLYLLYNRRREYGGLRKENRARLPYAGALMPEPDCAVVIRNIGVGMLLALFAGGWAWHGLNAYTGYGKLCRKAVKLSRERGITDIRTWNLARPENMDVYLNRPVTVVPGDEPPAPGSRPFLLLTRKRDLERFSGQEVQSVGNYSVIVFQKGDDVKNLKK